MSSQQQTAGELTGKPTRSKRAYRKPQLTSFGALRVMTQTGSGPSESQAGSASGHTCLPNYMANPNCPSDRNAKQNIVRIGTHPLGIGLYLFDYNPEFRDQWGHGRQFGVMAQEVEAVLPEAVCVHPDGYRMVNYAMLGIVRNVH